MHEAIEEEEDLVARVLRKFEWMEEKERSVERLNQVRRCPTSSPFHRLPNLNTLTQLLQPSGSEVARL